MQRYTWNFELPPEAECLGCRYSLAGVREPVCPECGREFNPPDRRTFGPKPPGPQIAWAAHGPGPATLIACGAAVVVWALSSSTPLGWPPWFGIALLLSFAVASAFTVRLLLSPFATGTVAAWLSALRRDRWRWLAVPLAALLCVVVVRMQVGWWMRWTISRPSMDLLAADARAGRPIAPGSWHGAIRVEEAQVIGAEVHARFDGGGNGLSDFTVLIHSPNSPPKPTYTVTPESLGGGWYVVAVD